MPILGSGLKKMGGLGSSANWAQYVATTIAPVAWWRFRDSASPAVNAGSAGSVLNLTGTAVTFAQTGQLGASEAVSFNATTSLLQCANHTSLANLTTFTLVFVAKALSAGEGSAGVFAIWGNGTSANGWFMLFNGALNSINFRLYNTATTQFVTTTNSGLAANQWAIVAVTYDNAGDRMARVYKNSAELSYLAQPAMTGTFQAPSAAFNIGNTSATSLTWDGLFDEVLICNRVLSGAELAQLARLSGF